VRSLLGTKHAQVAYVIVVVVVTAILRTTVSTTVAWAWLAATAVGVVGLAKWRARD
jgi:hypothetical protein